MMIDNNDHVILDKAKGKYSTRNLTNEYGHSSDLALLLTPLYCL